MPPIPTSPRAAKYEIENINDLLSQLKLSRILQLELGFGTDGIDIEIENARNRQRQLHSIANQRIESRIRAKKKPRLSAGHRPEYYMFLDECGSHITGNVDVNFPVFCLTGVIVDRSAYDAFDVTWKAWKTRYLGSPDTISHEPDLRSFSGAFRRSTKEERDELTQHLDDILAELDFTCISVVVDLAELQRIHPGPKVDEFLPSSCYLMAIDFIMERFVHFLQHAGDDAKGYVIAESRGLKEDAIVHGEFIQLHIRGTQFVSEKDFRYHLRPYIEFYRKKRNNSGLQIADLAARPFAEIVKNTEGQPLRWARFRGKLYDGLKESPHKYGLKVFPLCSDNDPFPEYERQAKGDT